MIHLRAIQSKGLTGRKYLVPFLCCVIGCGLGIVPRAKAAFIGNYALSEFTLINTNADGTAVTNDNGLSIILTGGNNGSDLGGTTDLVTIAPLAGVVAFSFVYSSTDFPSYDWAGYLLDGVFLQLADTDGQSGAASFQVAAGQVFGFRVETADNTGEAGVLTISNFTAPQANVPEPGALSYLTGITAVILAAWRRKWNREVRR